MVERWSIEPSPTRRDPKRYTLFLKADKPDVYALLRHFGSICGRPQKTSKQQFNYSIALHALEAQTLQSVEQFLSSSFGAAPTGAHAPVNGVGHAPSFELPPTEPTVAPSSQGAPPAEPPTERMPTPTPEPVAPALPLVEAVAVAAAASVVDELIAATDARQTFDALVVGPFNRFAHAAGTAVVSNPGTMYNPLVLFGVPGVGKSHFLSAIAHSLDAKLGAKPVLLTSGPKLARAASRPGKLEARIEDCGGLLIDDVHLLTFSDRNQATLKTVLHRFLDAGKPVVMTSVYPPKALQFMEEALDFQISAGYAVEVKLAASEVQVQILRSALRQSGLEASEPEAKDIQRGMGHAFFEFNRWLRRFRALKAAKAVRGQTVAVQEIVDALMPQAEASAAIPDAGAVKELLARMPAWELSKHPAAKTLALVFPAAQEEYAQLLLHRLKAAAAHLGLNLPVKTLAGQTYDPNQLFGVPLGIAEGCERAGAAAALVLGPTPQTQLSAREAELHHALDHMLAGLGIPLALVSFHFIEDPVHHLRAALDLYFGLWEPWEA